LGAEQSASGAPDLQIQIQIRGWHPDQRVASRSEEATPDQRVATPDQRVATPDQRVATPDQISLKIEIRAQCHIAIRKLFALLITRHEQNFPLIKLNRTKNIINRKKILLFSTKYLVKKMRREAMT
jgi:hypothetical protein